MTRSGTYRLWALIAALTLGTSCGGLVGYFAGRAHTVAETEDQLTRSANGVEGLLGSLLTESRALLATLNASHFAPCSPAEVAFLRAEVYEATNLRDAGRMQNGVMECSAFFDRKDLPQSSLKATTTEEGGLSFYRGVPLYWTAEKPAFVMSKGSFYVVEDPNFESQLNRFPWNVETTTVDAVSGERIRPSGLPLTHFPVLDRNWQGRDGDTLYVTRCSPNTPICHTTYGSLSAVLRADRRQIASNSVVGCLAGAFPVLVAALILERRRTLSRQLQRAIRRGRIAVLYQPIVELATRRVVGAEALSRWNDEDGYPVSPAIFVRLAEQRGFVHELTKMVLGRALRDFGAELLSQSEFRINVNVTGSDLGDARFVLMAEDAIASSGVAPERVVFEVTEGSTARTQMAIETIHELRRRGHRVEIDDFGTGYSSLSYLRDLAVDAIKIDRSFTQAIGTSAAIGGILPQILSIARSLSLLVIVEGIETAEQAEYFADFEGVVLGQGWLFGRPVSADEFHRLWLRSGANTSTAAAG